MHYKVIIEDFLLCQRFGSDKVDFNLLIFAALRRGGRVVECGGLENRCSPSGEPGVRIPLSPQRLNESRHRREYLFYRSSKESLLSDGIEEKEIKPEGFI